MTGCTAGACGAACQRTGAVRGRSKRGILQWCWRKGSNAERYWKAGVHCHHDHAPRDGCDFLGELDYYLLGAGIGLYCRRRRFFSRLVEGIRWNGRVMEGDPRTLMLGWLRKADPLHISEDPECGYGVPSGCVN
jgi:hypothetical protein